MKKLALLAAGVFALLGTSAKAQSYEAPATLQRISAFYDLTTLYPKGASNSYFNGFGVGYNVDFKVSKSLPLYVGTGLNARFLFHQKDLIDDEFYDAIEQDANVSLINLNVPINVSYRVAVANKFYLTPELGLDLRFQVYDHAKIDTEIERIVPGMDYAQFAEGTQGINLLSKNQMAPYGGNLRWFQLGWHAGLNFEYQRFSLGVSYGTDFIKLHKNLGASHFLVSLGYTF